MRAPRLLPLTIGMLGIVLASKITVLVHGAWIDGDPAALMPAARAAGAEAPAKAPAKPADTAAKPVDLAPPKLPAPEPSRTEANPPSEVAPVVPDSERAVLLELRERRRELDTREAALVARESVMAAAEMKLSARVEELQALQKKLESLDASHRQQEDVAWQGLVKVYETMKPRDAATIFNDLGMPVLLAVVDRMKEAKTAAILAAMTPDKARDVTTQLASLRTRSAIEAGDKPPATSPASSAATSPASSAATSPTTSAATSPASSAATSPTPSAPAKAPGSGT
jgi:flagellar motility protein MotE (MotC chaperone)